MTVITDERQAVRGVALFGEVLLIGVLVGVAALPVVTALAAAGAGAVLVDEVTDDRTPTVRRFVALLGDALREPVAWLAPVALLAIGCLDALALAAGLPGRGLLGPVLLALLVCGLLTGLRGAARWRPGHGLAPTLGMARRAVLRDWPGSTLLLGAVVVLAAVVAAAPAFLPVAPGLLVMAAVAVERRPARQFRPTQR